MHHKRSSTLLIAASAGALLIPLVALQGSASGSTSESRSTITGSKPSWAKPSATAGATKSGSTFTVRVYLAPRGGEARLRSAVAAVSSPGSKQFRHFLTPAQYRARFAPTRTSVAAVKSWLTSSGMHVRSVASGHRYVLAAGGSAAVQQAFGTGVGLFRHDGAIQRAPLRDISVPSAVRANVLGVVGLSSPQRVHRDSTPAAPPPAGFRNARPCSKWFDQLQARYQGDYSTRLPQFQNHYRGYAVCGYVPGQFRSAYGVDDSGLTGSGATVAIVDAYAAPTIQRDANTYAANQGDPRFSADQFQQFKPAAFHRQSRCGPSGWYGEETLDVEAVHGMATGADVRYYASTSCYDVHFLDTEQRVVDDNVASIVTNSWGLADGFESEGTIAAYEQIFQQGAMQGIGFLYSSGDSGDEVAHTGLKQTDYPSSDPMVTAVGGTAAAIGVNGNLRFEMGWGTRKYSLSSDGKSWQLAVPFQYGAGGGFSSLFDRPDYQDGVVPAGSPAGRGVPDIAMDADPTTGMLVGETQTFPDGVYYDQYRIGGTSLASPLTAGALALATEQAGERLGFANPAIYDLARSGSDAFNDVTAANDGRSNVRPDYVNGVDPSDGVVYSVRTFGDDSSLKTAEGWDEVTGVGSPNASFYAAMAGG